MKDSYDFVVIGSGSSGAIIAARLSENGKFSVLCLEAGTKGANYIFSKPPTGNVFMVSNPTVDWCLQAEPNETNGQRTMPVPRGKLLGGSSAINGMVVSRGQPADYDAWADQGCKGWSYEALLPYFRKLESTKIGTDDTRGRSGPVAIREASRGHSRFYDLFIASAKAAGVPYNEDYNGRTQFGVSMAQNSIRDGFRESTATAYLKPARKRANLDVMTGAEAQRLLMEGTRCTGVEVKLQGALRKVRAKREVIVACGASHSPKLLELSGIGDRALLNKLGIAVVKHLPGVGENLRDHYGAMMKWRFKNKGISIARQGRGLPLLLQVLRYGLFRTGFISQGLGTMRAFLKSRSDLPDADILVAAAPFILEVSKSGRRKMSKTEGFFLYTHYERPETQGSIHIQSSDPAVPPRIDFRFLETAEDRRVSVMSIRRCREIVAQAPIGAEIAEELSPGPAVESDAEILAFLRHQGTILHHMVGTCRMGHDEMAVVDDELRVHGIDGLRVADASIMPTLTSGNTSIPAMVVGEKCADLILARLNV